MNLVEAITEAKAIDGRAIAGVVPPLEDTLRAFELVEYFDTVVQDEANETQRAELAKLIVEGLG